VGWQRHNGSGAGLAGEVNKNAQGQFEGVIDLVTAFGTVPETLYLASLAVQTPNGGALAAQAPAPVVPNGNIEPSELIAVKTEALRDSGGDNRYDVMVPERRFRATLDWDESGQPRLRWPVVPGRAYRVAAKSSLADSGWIRDLPGSRVVAPTTAASDTATYSDPSENVSTRFYVIEMEP
jgi:hypothetical protein